MGEYHRALESYRTAMEVWKEKLGAKHPNVLQSYFNIGEAYGALKDYSSARPWLMQSLILRTEVLGEKNVKTAQSCNALGTMYSEWGKSDSSMVWYRRAAAALTEGSNDSSDFTSQESSSSLSDPDLRTALTGIAKGLFLRGSSTNERTDLDASLKTFDAAVRLTEKIRRGFGTEGSKLQLSQTSFDVYEQALTVAVRLYDRTKDEEYLSAAFSYAERSKAGMLFDAVDQMNAQRFSGIPDSLLEVETTLRTGITYNETQLQKEKEKKEKRNAKTIARYENILFDLKRNYEQLISTFERSYPSYFSLRHRSMTFPLKKVRELLPDKNSALIEYFVGDSTVTMFTVTKDRSLYKTVRLPKLSDQVKQFRNAVHNAESEPYLKHAAALYADVFLPIRSSLKGIKKLIIVPDGILHYLPFEALLTAPNSRTGPIDFSSLPYLIKEYEVSYLASARLLEMDPASISVKDHRSFLGIAPVFSDMPPHSKKVYAGAPERVKRSRKIDGERFTELKESENEVKDIADLFTSRNIPASIALHQDAEESLLSAEMIGRYGFIHIASHGVINETSPKLSGIIFSEPKKGSVKDGVLYAGEIYDLRLNADLVVLSACETGLGTIVKGEGMIGLTRGFMYAGARNLLVSLWQVGDRSTAELMVQFYKNILNERPFSAALRNAKLAMIKQGRYAHPVEWSPFILNGR
jgi:CHAT domain-containing protein